MLIYLRLDGYTSSVLQYLGAFPISSFFFFFQQCPGETPPYHSDVLILREDVETANKEDNANKERRRCKIDGLAFS